MFAKDTEVFENLALMLEEAAESELTEIPEKQKQPYITEETWKLLDEKEEANEKKDWDKKKELDKRVSVRELIAPSQAYRAHNTF